MVKCRRFWTTTEQDKNNVSVTKNATHHFNMWSSDEVEIVSTHVLHDNHGTCTEVVVFIKTSQKSLHMNNLQEQDN